MRYSRGTSSLLSTLFTFEARSVVAVDIFEQTRDGAGVDIDAGVLTPLDSVAKGTNKDVAPSGLVSIASTCDADKIVTCVNGFDVNSPGGATTCFESCAGDCCSYGDQNACIGFTGKVCKDGSCNGAEACRSANIPLVVNSCIGYNACVLAGSDGGSIGNVNGSCNGERACAWLGSYNGQVGNVINSCHGGQACISTASKGGTIGSITNSCYGFNACPNLGDTYGDVGNLLNSCNGKGACEWAAVYGGSIDGMTGSCSDNYACYDLGGRKGKVGFVTDSCTGENSCMDAGFERGSIGSISQSCTAENACLYAGSKRGSIGSISQSCKAENSCKLAGNGQTGVITSNLNSCCNTRSSPGVCESATERTLPAQCTHRSKSAKKTVDIFDQTSNEAVVDAGILTLLDSGAKGTNNDVAPSGLVSIAATCDADKIVTCVNGFDVDSPGGATTCFASCGDLCCASSDQNACEGFTGKVCKDGSCNGAAACASANIPLVVNSCIGYHACVLAGSDGGSIGNVIDSCNGEVACAWLGSCNGQVGNVINSCKGDWACSFTAGMGGTIGSITNSCDGSNACLNIGHTYGEVGNLLNSCKSANACESAASRGGFVDAITGSCTDFLACYHLGGRNGKVGFVTDSCTGEHSCLEAGTGRGSIWSISQSCTAENSCLNAASQRGSIGSISQSCTAENACKLAGNGQTGAITSNLKSCCNTLSSPGVCESATELTLPAQCTHRSKSAKKRARTMN